MEPLPKLIHNTQSNHFSGTAHCALEILTDHAEIQASIFRGAIAERKELKDFPFSAMPEEASRALGPGPGPPGPGPGMPGVRWRGWRRPAAR